MHYKTDFLWMIGGDKCILIPSNKIFGGDRPLQSPPVPTPLTVIVYKNHVLRSTTLRHTIWICITITMQWTEWSDPPIKSPTVKLNDRNLKLFFRLYEMFIPLVNNLMPWRTQERQMNWYKEVKNKTRWTSVTEQQQ